VTSPAIPNAEWTVSQELEGEHLDRTLKARFPSFSWNQVRAWVRGGNVFVEGERATDAATPLESGARIEVWARPSERKKPQKGATTGDARPAEERPRQNSPLIVYADSQVVVALKPAGISTVPYDSSERDTLDRRIQKQLAREGSRARLLVVHRIDKETSGLVVFARTQHALERLKSQFRFHTTERKYLALVHGHPRSQKITTMLVRDRGDGLRGSTRFLGQGREATTHVDVLETFDSSALVACRLETGRTHQIRIHLAEEGHPLLGERVYSKGFSGPLLEAPRVLLHAATLGFAHPTDGRPLRFESPLPPDFAGRLEELRRPGVVR
jgi:23S rRNA pseudouridine1911/1915/1917 synthase